MFRAELPPALPVSIGLQEGSAPAAAPSAATTTSGCATHHARLALASCTRALAAHHHHHLLPAAARCPSAPPQRTRHTTTATRASSMEAVTFGSGLPGFEAGDKSSPAAIIVLQEWWGVNHIIKEQAQMIADATGYRVLIPDLYKGKIGVDKEEAHHLMSNLDFPAAVKELGQAVAHLKASGATKTGVVGFCMGGALAFAAAQHAGVDAAAPFYGIPDPAICDIKVPVQCHFGGLDTMKGFSNPEAIAAVVDKMKAAGANVELHMYPGSGHGFLNALTEEGRAKIKQIGQAEPPADEPRLAMERLVAFMQQHLA